MDYTSTSNTHFKSYSINIIPQNFFFFQTYSYCSFAERCGYWFTIPSPQPWALKESKSNIQLHIAFLYSCHRNGMLCITVNQFALIAEELQKTGRSFSTPQSQSSGALWYDQLLTLSTWPPHILLQSGEVLTMNRNFTEGLLECPFQ